MKKLSLLNVRGNLSRSEMKNIMAGSSGTGCQMTECRGPADCGQGSGCWCQWGRCFNV
jgi:hypothetical protein